MDKDFLLKDMNQANGEASLIRKAYNEETWEEFKKCSFAFFPGCQLPGAEPEMIIKAYDSIRFQHPDTAIFLHCCGFAAQLAGESELLNETLEYIKAKWEMLGKPTMIMACMTCYKLFKENLPEIPLVSFYEFLQDSTISGGCNSVDYCIKDPESAKAYPDVMKAVRELAEEMGVKLHEAESAGNEAADSGENSDESDSLPYLVYSINERDALKRQGKDAVHILELIYGMGDSNLHMVHEHDHEHEGDVSCGIDNHDMNDTAPVNKPSDSTAVSEASDEQAAIRDKIAAAFAEADCDGDCMSCTSDCGMDYSAYSGSAPLPTDEERMQNRLELKQTMLEFFWNEF